MSRRLELKIKKKKPPKTAFSIVTTDAFFTLPTLFYHTAD